MGRNRDLCLKPSCQTSWWHWISRTLWAYILLWLESKTLSYKNREEKSSFTTFYYLISYFILHHQLRILHTSWTNSQMTKNKIRLRILDAGFLPCDAHSSSYFKTSCFMHQSLDNKQDLKCGKKHLRNRTWKWEELVETRKRTEINTASLPDLQEREQTSFRAFRQSRAEGGSLERW